MAIFSSNLLLPLLVIFLTTYSHLMLRSRISALGDGVSLKGATSTFLFTLSTDLWLLSAVGSFFLGFLCWSLALSNDVNAAKIYPIMTALTILFVSVLNFYIFQDDLNIYNFIGIFSVIVGVILILK